MKVYLWAAMIALLSVLSSQAQEQRPKPAAALTPRAGYLLFTDPGRRYAIEFSKDWRWMIVAFIPPADAVQEFKVETVSFDAQQAHGAGATVNVALKTGTNTLHGTLYDFIRNDVLSANDYFLNRAGTPRRATAYVRQLDCGHPSSSSKHSPSVAWSSAGSARPRLPRASSGRWPSRARRGSS